MNPIHTNDPDAIPAALMLTPEQRAAGRAKSVATTKASNGVTLASLSAPSTPAPTKAPKVSKEKKPVVAKTPKAAKVAKASKPHQPSTIARTEANPAKSIVPVKFKQAYAAHNDTCGTKLALALKTATTHKNEDGRDALDLKALEAIAKANGIDYTAYAKLNNGQKRMNVGNKLAGLLKAGKKVVVGKQTFANAEKALTKEAIAA